MLQRRKHVHKGRCKSPLPRLAAGPSSVNMTDVKFGTPRSFGSPLFLRDEELKLGVDLLFFAMRDLTGDADGLLREAGLGRAHSRALTMVGRRPGLSVSELLSVLKITKQSLNRVLGDLLDQGYVEQKPAPSDRRKRLLRLTDRGQALEESLWEAQRARVMRAFREAGPEGVAGFRKVVSGLADTPKQGRSGGAR